MKQITSLILISLIYGTFCVLPSSLTNFGVLTKTATIQGGSYIQSPLMLGISNGTITYANGPSDMTVGVTHINNSITLNARNDAVSFYNQLGRLPCTTDLSGQDLGGKTLFPGVYCFNGSANISGTLLFDSQNKPSPFWLFQITNDLVLNPGGYMTKPSAQTAAFCNAFWNIGNSFISKISSYSIHGIFNVQGGFDVSPAALVRGKVFSRNGNVAFSSSASVFACNELNPQQLCGGIWSNDTTVCNSNGTCISGDLCSCNNQTNGTLCQFTNCYSKSAGDLSVCSGQGTCSSLNTCTCNPGRNGTECQLNVCYSKDSSDTTVCSGKGICSSPNNCICNTGFNGTQCELPNCFSRSANDLLVCGGTGTCSSTDNCTCSLGYNGTDCKLKICYSKNSNDNSVCSGVGTCSSPNNCICNTGFNGTQCELSNCFSRSANDSLVCGGTGTCSSTDNCTCFTGYTGSRCQNPICYSRSSNDTMVCSGAGTCLSPNNCICNSQYVGTQCELPLCYSINSTNSMVCNQRGICRSPNTCNCSLSFTGSQCEISCPNDFSSFAVLAKSISNNGRSTITGDLGTFPGSSVSGFQSASISGNIFLDSIIPQNGQASVIKRYSEMASIACRNNLGQSLGGTVLKAGVYCFNTTALITGILTLDGDNDPFSFWLFQIGTTLTISPTSTVTLINGAVACNIFWNVASSVTIGPVSTFFGNVLSNSITIGASATVTGKLLAQGGSVSMDSNIINNCPIPCSTTCSGRASTDSLVCGGKGSCVFPGFCVCSANFGGNRCQLNTTRINSSTSNSAAFVLILLLFLIV